MRVLGAVSVVMLVGLLWGSVPGWAARGHEFAKALGSACVVEPCAAGSLKEPAGVGVDEASGDVYVVDRAAGLVTKFDEAGGVLAGFGNNGVGGVANGQLAGPSAVGSGNLTEESPLVEEALAVSGFFSVGEEVTGEGIPAGTTIVEVLGNVLMLSQAVEAGKSGLSVALSASQHFAEPTDIAVDNSCQLHKPVLSESTVPTCAEFDPSDGDIYIADVGAQVIDKFSATGVFLDQLTGLAGLGLIDGVGVDPRGELWVGGKRGASVFSNKQLNAGIESVNAAQVEFNEAGFAVNAADDLFFHQELGPVFETGPHGCPASTACGGNGEPPEPGLINGAFDPEGSEWLAVEFTTGDVYVEHGDAVLRRAPDGSVVESLGSAVGPGELTAGAGVGVDASRERVFVAEPVVGEVFEYEREPPGAPLVPVSGMGVSKVTGDSATLEGEVDPHGPSTTYHFAYGPCASVKECPASAFGLSAPVPDASAGSGFDAEPLAPLNVQGLERGTAYHFRLVASNGNGVVDGPERTFTTQSAGKLVLADNREWEMVSPVDKHGAVITSDGREAVAQAAAGGGAFVFATGAPTESEPQGNRGIVQVLAVRGADGWPSHDLTLPHVQATGVSVGEGSEFRLFSGDLSQSLVQPLGAFVACEAGGVAQPCLSALASEQTPMLRSSFVDGNPSQPCLPQQASCYVPLVTGVAGAANVPAGTAFGEEGECSGLTPNPFCGPKFRGASADLTHVVLESRVPLTAPSGGNLYEWSAGKAPGEQLAPVTILPADEGGGPEDGTLGNDNHDMRDAVSSDGSRVFWSINVNVDGEGPLYVRDIAKGETLRLGAAAEFQDVSEDGSRVFYTEASVLYECHLVEGAGGALECEGGPKELASGVLGTIPGVSGDGSWVYFVASSVLAEHAVPGAPNMYVHHDGTTSLVGVLSSEDSPDWAGKDTGNLTPLISRVSPDGEWLAFMSDRSLTGYDNRDAKTGAPDEELFLYDASTGDLACASCDPSGARPVGEEAEKVTLAHGGLVAGEAWENSSATLAASVPGWNPYREGTAVYQPRFLGDSGRLFFDGRDGLVPAAVNEGWDVYEYEPAGVGPAGAVCGAGVGGGGVVFKPEGGVLVEGRGVVEGAGCVGLISSGESDQESAFLDASESGGDVFFMTSAKLSEADLDTAYDVYDAHECTGVAPCFPAGVSQPPGCDEESSCRPAPSPQPEVFGAPASETFSGPGNVTPEPVGKPKTAAQLRAEKLAKALKACRKDKRASKRKACERQARTKYGAKKASAKKPKKATGARRASRVSGGRRAS